MDIDSFIGRNRAHWERLAKMTSRGPRGLSRLEGEEIQEVVRLYLKASADLAEVQTRYRDPKSEAYLTSVVARAHSSIYGTRPRTLSGALRLFGDRYRSAFRRTVPFVIASTLLMMAVGVASFLWVAGTPEAAAGVIPGYVAEQVQGAGGGPTVDQISPAVLSTFILFNNLRVAFIAFATGISFGLISSYVMAQNAMLIGGLAAVFHANGKAWFFWSHILPHGFLELTAIFIASGAGLRMGWSLIAPGDRTRGVAIVAESRDSVLVVLGAIPAFVVAALIEGFITPSDIPGGLQIALGAIVTAAYIGFLFRRSAEPLTSEPPVGLDRKIPIG